MDIALEILRKITGRSRIKKRSQPDLGIVTKWVFDRSPRAHPDDEIFSISAVVEIAGVRGR
jgi:hypothetical protein